MNDRVTDIKVATKKDFEIKAQKIGAKKLLFLMRVFEAALAVNCHQK